MSIDIKINKGSSGPPPNFGKNKLNPLFSNILSLSHFDHECITQQNKLSTDPPTGRLPPLSLAGGSAASIDIKI